MFGLGSWGAILAALCEDVGFRAGYVGGESGSGSFKFAWSVFVGLFPVHFGTCRWLRRLPCGPMST